MTVVKTPPAAKRPSSEEIKALMSAAQRESQRTDDAKLAHALLGERARARGQAQALLLPQWEKMGVDIKGLEKIQAETQQTMRRLVDERKAAAIKESGAAQKILSSRAAEWVQRMQQRKDSPVEPQFSPRLDFVETPIFIWPTHGLFFDDSHIEPLNSWGKVHLPRTGNSNGSEHLSFWFFWQNPDDAFALINIASFLSLNGTAECTADGGWAGIFPGGTSGLQLAVNLIPWLLPNTQAPAEATQWTQVLNLSANGGGWFGAVGDIELRDVRGADFVSYTQMIVPPQAGTLLEVQLTVNYQNDDGTAEIDFASGDFKVLCPLVAISILT